MTLFNKKRIVSLYFVLFILFSTFSFAQNQGNCPNNIDFEFGDFTNWVTSSGRTNPGPTYVFNSNALNTAVHVILDAANYTGQNDFYGGFPVLCPNGSGYSVKLGNTSTGFPKAQRLSYTFNIPAGSVRYSLTYYYAVVLNQGTSGHDATNQPRFTVNLINQSTGLPVGCSAFDYNANNGASNGFVQSPQLANGVAVFTKNWTPVTIDLTGLNGQTIQLEFITNNCAFSSGGHFGYAYIDIGATCITPVNGYAYCTGANSITLTAPFGYQNYIWYDQNYLPLGNNQTLIVSPAPPNGTIYNIDLIPFPFGGCRDTLPITTEEQIPPDTPVAQSYYLYCQSQPASQLSATANPGYITQWYLTAVGGTPLGAPPTPNTGVIGITDYYVSQKSFGGCEGPRKKVTVEVKAPPTAEFSINDTLQCISGNNFQFTNLSTGVGVGTNYTWDFGDLSPNVTTLNASHTYSSTGTFTVTLTVNIGVCTTVKAILVSVNPRPVANFSFGTACQGTSFTFMNNTTGGSIDNVYTWDFGNGLTSTQTNPTVVLNTAGINNIKLSVNDGTCTDDTTKQVMVYEVPKANFTYSNACVNDSIQFTDISTLSLGTINAWVWDFGNGQTSQLQNPKMAFTTNGPQVIKLTVASATCSKDTTITINVDEKPIAKFNLIDTACETQFVRMQDASYYASGAPNSTINNWWWDAGNGNIYTSTSIGTTYNNATNTYEVKQVVYTSQGCRSDTNKVIINVHPLPIAQMNFLSALCENRPLAFEDISSPNIKARNWTFSNGFISNNKNIIVNNIPYGVNNVKLAVQDSFGCISKTIDSNFIVHKRPDIDFAYLDSCLERPVTFNAIDGDINYVTQWKWNFEGTTFTGNATQNYQFAKFGTNKVFLYALAANGCVSDTIYKTLNLRYTPANAGKDIIAALNEPKQLGATGGVLYNWSPSIGLDNPAIQNPIATNNTDRIYTVKVTSIYGCNSFDDVKVTIYKGPDIYVPTIFTPNLDGMNDVLQITLVGITKYKGIKIFNRFGKIIFESKDANKSWDGRVNNKDADGDAYVWIAEGVDFKGNAIYKKGTVVLAR